MVGQTIFGAVPFFLTLAMFVLAYTHILMLIYRKDSYGLFRIAYTLTLGELDEFQELSSTAFCIFVAFSVLITLVLTNLVIAVLSDKYEEVTADK